jgi:hypothetical protein
MFQHYFKFIHPSPIIIVGPTQSGKTEFTINLLKNRDSLFHPPPTRIIWAYGQKNDKQLSRIAEIAPIIEFYSGLPNTEALQLNPNENNLIIYDDLMDEIASNNKIKNLFTRESHHLNTTVIAIIHNLFNQEKYMRSISLNTHYFIIFQSPRDNRQISYFGGQVFPKNPRFLGHAFQLATEKPFGYLVIDLRPNTIDSLRVCNGILPNEIPQIFTPT